MKIGVSDTLTGGASHGFVPFGPPRQIGEVAFVGVINVTNKGDRVIDKVVAA